MICALKILDLLSIFGLVLFVLLEVETDEYCGYPNKRQAKDS